MTTNKKCNNTTSVISNLIYLGFTAGYFNGNTATPEAAAKAAAEALKAETSVFPGVCVYHTDWGCPKGGESVAAFRLSGSVAEILRVAEEMRVRFEQSTLSVAIENEGVETIGFEAEASGYSLQEMGAKWQEMAAKMMTETGVYVSCGIADMGDHLVISAEANPEFVQDLAKWSDVVEKISHELGIEPKFMDTKFNYLKK